MDRHGSEINNIMKRSTRLILAVTAIAFPKVACAQQTFTPNLTNARPTITVTLRAAVAFAIVRHLSQGGTRTDADELAREIVEAAEAPNVEADKEADLRKKIEAEMKAKSTPPVEPKP
jgi:hypothetical protein